MASSKQKADQPDKPNRVVHREFGGDNSEALERGVPDLPPNQQNIRVEASSKGRKGKTVTIVRGFRSSPDTLTDLLKKLKTHCGAGGTLKDGEIEIQGDHKQKIVQYLIQVGYKAKKVAEGESSLTIDTILEPFAHFGVRLGLEASQQLLANLGNPHERVPTIHVAGTNGKGSVCAFLSSMLVEAGYQVGRYTSPHLVDWTERICLNGQPISESELTRLLEKITAIARSQTPVPTQFEIMTAAAWLYFAQQDVNVAVMEVGLGGRLDATNVCDRPLVSVITSISRDHCHVLGESLAAIAAEKAGILKPNCPAVIGQLPPEASRVIFRRGFQLGCALTYPQPAKDAGNGWADYQGIEEYEFETESSDPDEVGILHLLTTIRYRLPLLGAVQLHNSALAIATLQTLREQGWEISDDAIADGIAKTQWAGRLQWIKWRDRPILLDGAHNLAGAEALREFVTLTPPLPTPDSRSAERSRRSPLPTHWIIGMLANKDHAAILRALLRSGDRLHLVPVPDHKSADPQQLTAIAWQECPDLQHCYAYPNVAAALDAAMQATETTTQPAETQAPIVVCGSLYLIGNILRQIKL